MTGGADSSLARHADLCLDSAVDQEACPLNLAPTASTTAQMALGDALAVALLDARGFREEDFARSHPGGALGRKLLTHVRDVMRAGDAVPRVAPHAGFIELMREMTDKGLGATAVVDARIACSASSPTATCAAWSPGGWTCARLRAHEVMHPRPHLVRDDALAVDAADLMERHRVTSLLVVDADARLCRRAELQRPDAREGHLMSIAPGAPTRRR